MASNPRYWDEATPVRSCGLVFSYKYVSLFVFGRFRQSVSGGLHGYAPNKRGSIQADPIGRVVNELDFLRRGPQTNHFVTGHALTHRFKGLKG